MSDVIYQDPNKDVNLLKATRGDIVCRNLFINKKCSLLGNVKAVNIENHGHFQGSAVALEKFSNCEESIFRGTVASSSLYVHENSVFEASNSRKLDGDNDTPSVLTTMSFIEKAVEDGIRRQVVKDNISKKSLDEIVAVDPVVESKPAEIVPVEMVVDEADVLEVAPVSSLEKSSSESEGDVSSELPGRENKKFNLSEIDVSALAPQVDEGTNENASTSDMLMEITKTLVGLESSRSGADDKIEPEEESVGDYLRSKPVYPTLKAPALKSLPSLFSKKD